MSLVRFFFGHGWWTLMYVSTYVILAITVGLMLLVFGQDLKLPGQTPDLPSPASIMVVMICIGLASMTACFAGVGIGIRFGVGWGVAAAFALSAIVLVGDGYLNIWLAESQSVRAYYVNVAVAAIIVLANLGMMHAAINGPANPARAIAPPPLPVVVTTANA